MIKTKNKKGTIGITIVMLVFCMLMAVSMSYHKTLQTERIIKNNVNYSDRAMDAAFSGVNYAMALIQSNKSVFSENSPTNITISNNPKSSSNYKSEWISLATSSKFSNYYDEDRKIEGNPIEYEKIPPYRFKVSCMAESYSSPRGKILIKSYGEYLKYDQNTVTATYSAQIMAECEINTVTRTISLKRYRKMPPQINFDENGNETNTDFYSFYNTYDYTKDKNND